MMNRRDMDAHKKPSKTKKRLQATRSDQNGNNKLVQKDDVFFRKQINLCIIAIIRFQLSVTTHISSLNTQNNIYEVF